LSFPRPLAIPHLRGVGYALFKIVSPSVTLVFESRVFPSLSDKLVLSSAEQSIGGIGFAVSFLLGFLSLQSLAVSAPLKFPLLVQMGFGSTAINSGFKSTGLTDFGPMRQFMVYRASGCHERK